MRPALTWVGGNDGNTVGEIIPEEVAKKCSDEVLASDVCGWRHVAVGESGHADEEAISEQAR